MKIALGADHRGYEVYRHLCMVLRENGHEVLETLPKHDGEACDYPDRAWPVAKAVAERRADRGILICGTGIGMSIAANKVAGVRAALVHDEVGADLSRRHNDANVLCLAAGMVGGRTVDRIVIAWLNAPFEGGRHARRVHKVAAIENAIDPNTVGREDQAVVGQ
jgi:ribose 5-phosphate isomerase B